MSSPSIPDPFEPSDSLQGMVPEDHELVLPATAELRDFFKSSDFQTEVCQMLRSSYEVTLQVQPGTDSAEMQASSEERLVLAFTRNNAGGLKDAIDFLVSRLIPHGLDAATVKGAIPRPKSDSFEDSLPFFDSKLLHNAPAPLGTDSPTRPSFADDSSERGSLFGKIKKPGSISSISSFLDRRKNQPSPSGSFFKQASSNASRASLVSMESRDSGYRNPWNDSGINLPEDDTINTNGWPLRFDNKSQNSLNKLSFGAGPAYVNAPGDMTPRHDPRASFDSGRPSTSHSTNGYPVPIGTPR